MPLLRKKPFARVKPPSSLRADDEVFYCELTGEVFVDYEAFYQRMILCNSLVWSCEHSGKPNLTYKEALDSEEQILKSVRNFPTPLKYAVLMLVHHTRRSKIQVITDEIFDYIKNRFQKDEKVEVKLKDKWYSAVVDFVPDECNVTLLKTDSEAGNSPLKTPSKVLETPKYSSPIGHKEQWPDAAKLEYKLLVIAGPKKGSFITSRGNQIRRPKNLFNKEKMKLYLKQTCRRTTVMSDDGYWVVNDKEVKELGLGQTTVVPPTPVIKSTSKKKKKKKSLSGEIQEIRDKKDFFAKAKKKKKSKKSDGKADIGDDAPLKQFLSQEEKKQLQEKEKEKKKLELEVQKIKKMKEREAERARKKDEQRKEKEMQTELKKVEANFLKEYNKPREDLKLEDLKPLPTFVPFKCNVNQDLVGDIMMIVEFVNIFGNVFESETEIDGTVNMNWLVEALTEHDTEGKYFQLLKFLLHSYLRVEREENEAIYEDEDEDGKSSSEDENDDSDKKKLQKQETIENNEKSDDKTASSNARAAAAWPMLYQGMALHEITIEPFSLTEVLRLHILSSGVRIGGIRNYNEWLRRGQSQLADDPCVWFRHEEVEIMSKLCQSSVYDLTAREKLKLLVLLCNQSLTLSSVRDYMEEAAEKLKELRKKHRDLLHEEKVRKKRVAEEKRKKVLAERKKKKQEIEKLKQEKKQLALKAQADKESGKISNVDVEKEKEKIVQNGVEEETKENGISEDTKTAKELELERKAKKEAKEQQVEAFFRDKFLFNEQQIFDEIDKYSAVVSEHPLGRDRLFRKYWKLTSVDGIFVENDDNGAMIISDLPERDCEIESESEYEDEADEKTEHGEFESRDVSEKKTISKVTFEELLMAKESGTPLTEIIFNRYKCEYNKTIQQNIDKSNMLKPILIDIENGLDPNIYAVNDNNKWYNVSSKEQFDALLTSLSSRGIREKELRTSLIERKEKYFKYFDNKLIEEEKQVNKKIVPAKKKSDPKSDEIDKSLFKTMDDYIEGNLRDQILELEERLYIASFGGITSVDREKWRADIEEGMANLVHTENLENGDNQNMGMEVDEKESEAVTTNGHINGNGDTEIKIDQDKRALNALPLHMKRDDSERCSTPELDQTFEKNKTVTELAEALLQIEQDLELKYLKQPLGDSEVIKKERLKEMLEDKVKNDDDKRPSCLMRWEESLINCTSFSQVFVHLNTLDRSIMWDKSVQNVKCRVCKRKGNEEEMLLCDGCDRGFHMSCLKPALKRIPQGDWYCKDCRPMEVKRRSRKVSICKEEEETEEEEEEEIETEEEDEEEDGDSDDEEDEEESDDGDEDEEDSEEESDSESDDGESVHGESCTVCNKDGTLILCEDCPRSYHVECVYPAIRKVPRGIWKCQICTGLDKELPYRKRAQTVEKMRENPSTEKKKSRTQQRGQPAPDAPKKGVKRTQKSPPVKPAKKAKLDSVNNATAQVSQRSFGRQQLKQCSILLSDIFKQEEALVFLEPVDLNEVPDYTDFIDEPIDFGSIRRYLNNGKYDSVQSFTEDIFLVFTNCETYNPPKSTVARNGAKLKTFVKKRMKDLHLT